MKSGIVFVASSPLSVVAFLAPHIIVLEALAPVQVFANTKDTGLLKQHGLDLEIGFVPIVRPISLWFDIWALWVLFRQFRRIQPKAVHSITPKAGLLTMVAAWLAGVPIRAHSFTGQVWVNKTGLKRWLLKSCDKLIAFFATNNLIDSHSQRAFLIEEGVVGHLKSDVLGAGSICGVDIQRFCPNLQVREALRARMGVGQKTFVCLYLGRLNKDKGIFDLVRAFSKLASSRPNVELWLVGPDEQGMYNEVLNMMEPVSGQLRRVDYTSEPERFMQSADLFCLPSHREGFGSSIIEAAACRVPSLVSRIYGLADAVIEGRTGWVHEAGNVNDITNNLETILMAPDEIKNRGKAARSYVENTFEQSLITGAMKRFYRTRLGV